MARPLDLTLLRTFVEVVDCNSILGAAARVGRSQSAISMQIQRLEEDVGQTLFDRQGRTLRLNPAGKELLIYARRLLSLSELALASIQRPDVTGRVRLGLPEEYATYLLLPALGRFLREHPLVEVELTFDTSSVLPHQVEAEHLDLAFVTLDQKDGRTILRRERFVWAASADHLAWLRSPLPIALYDLGDVARRFALESLQAADLPYRVVCSTRSLQGLIAVAQAGLAVVALAESTLPPGLVEVGGAEGLPALPMLDLGLIYRRGESNRAALQLRQFLARDLGQFGDPI